MRLGSFLLPLLLCASAARAQDAWDALARGVDARDPTAVHRARVEAERTIDGFWTAPRRGGPLLAACARDLRPREVRALFDRAGQDVPSLRGLLANLSAREDLPALLLDRGIGDLLATDLLRDALPVVEGALVHGDPALAEALLADPRSTARVGVWLADRPRPEGPRLLADAVLGDVPLPPEARSLLGLVEPDLQNRYVVRPLGTQRIRKLADEAARESDPALRVLAARELAASLDPAADAVLFDAFVHASSWRIEPSTWSLLGRDRGLLPGAERLPIRALLQLLEGYVGHSHVYASSDPDAATEIAAALGALWTARTDVPTRLQLLRFFDEYHAALVDDTLVRPWAPAPWLDLLRTWESGRDPWAPGIDGLARRVADRAKALLLEPHAPVRPYPPKTVPRPPSPVLALLPDRRHAREVTEATVRGWLQADPLHLYGPAVRARLRSWGSASLERVLDLYPRPAIEVLLDRPPTRTAARGGWADDLDGSTARSRLLPLLFPSAMAREVALDPKRALAWPEANRRTLGVLVAKSAEATPPQTLATLLGDDAFALGYAREGLRSARPLPFAFAARLVAGLLDRPRLRALLADADADRGGPPDGLEPPEDAASDPTGVPVLGADVLQALRGMLDREADPYLVMWAPRVLALENGDADVQTLLDHADVLGVWTVWSRYTVSDLAYDVRSPARLDVLLDFVGRGAASSGSRVALYRALLTSLFSDADVDAEVASALCSRLIDWSATTLGTLDADAAEGCLLALLEAAAPDDDTEARVRSAFTMALASIAEPGVRVRLQHALEAGPPR